MTIPSTNLNNKPPIRAVPMEVFPTADSLREVVELGFSKLPIADQNELYSLLMSYHNTLLQELRSTKNHHVNDQQPTPRSPGKDNQAL